MKNMSKRCTRPGRIVKKTLRRGGGKFSRYSIYFPKRLRNYTTAQIAQHAIIENSGLALGKIARPFKGYFLKNGMREQPNVPRIVETFKPLYAWDKIKPVNIIDPKSNIEPIANTNTQKVFDLSSTHRQIGDILYHRTKPPHKSRVSSSHSVSARNSRYSQNSRNSRYSQNSRNSRYSQNRGP